VQRADAIRTEILRLIRAAPLESGDRVMIEHPENIAFDPETREGDGELYVISGKLRLFSTFGAVSSVPLADRGGAAA
jgi:hypothetical protein